jgi:hypothetical protein
MLNVVMLKVVMLNVVMLKVIMLNVVMLIVVMISEIILSVIYAECHIQALYAGYRYEIIVMLSVTYA